MQSGKLRKIDDLTDLLDGTFKPNYINGIYCLVGCNAGYIEWDGGGGSQSLGRFDLMGLPIFDETGGLQFSRIDYNEKIHKGFVYIDYADWFGYQKAKNEKRVNQKVENSLVKAQIKKTPSVLDQYRNSETLSKKRKLSGGKKTRKHKK